MSIDDAIREIQEGNKSQEIIDKFYVDVNRITDLINSAITKEHIRKWYLIEQLILCHTAGDKSKEKRVRDTLMNYIDEK